MSTVLGYILALLVVGGVLFLAASFAFGRGEEMAPVLPEGTPLELPHDRLARGDDLRALKLSVALRGYRMDEVDWLLDRLCEQVDSRDREIARLRSVLRVEPVAGEEPALLTHPLPTVRDVDQPEARPSGGPADDGTARSAEDGSGAGWSAEDRGGWPAEDRDAGWSAEDRDAGWPAEDRDGGGWAPRPVPEGTEVTDARPDRPARDIRTHGRREPE